MTDWETTKIKGDVKAEAKELDKTYTEIMEAGIKAIQNDGEECVDSSTGEIVSSLEERIDALQYDGQSSGETVTFDDVKNACGAAIEEELGELLNQ